MRDLINEQDFDNLFNECINLVTENNDQGKREIVEAISDIYEIKEYIPEITLYEKRIKQRLLVFKYETDPSVIPENYYNAITSHLSSGYKNNIISKRVDLDFTIRSFYTFFISIYYYKSDDDLIDKSSIEGVILPALEKMLAYITSHKD